MTSSKLGFLTAAVLAACPAAYAVNCNTFSPTHPAALPFKIPASMGTLPPALLKIQPNGCINGPIGRHVGHVITPGSVSSAVNVIPPAPQPPAIGTTAAAVQAQFPAVYLFNVQQNPAYDAQFALLDDYMLANLSNEYLRNKGNVPALMNLMAIRLTAAHLVRLKAAFGAAVDAGVAAAATPTVKAQYYATGAPAPLRMSHAQYVSLGIGAYFPPEFSMTQYDLFLEYFAVKGATVASALVRMAAFEAQVLYSTFQVSYWVGGKLVAILDKVDPNINIEIGNIIGVTVDDIVDLVSTPYGDSYVDLPGFYDYSDFGDFDFEWDWNAWF